MLAQGLEEDVAGGHYAKEQDHIPPPDTLVICPPNGHRFAPCLLRRGLQLHHRGLLHAL